MVDLSGDAAALAARLKQRCRRQIRKAEQMGLVVRPAATLDETLAYRPVLERFHAERGLGLESIPPIEAQWAMTRGRGAFLLGWLGGEVVAGHTVMAEGDRGFWLTLAAREVAPDLPKGYALVWEALRLCQAQGLKRYDMAGAPAADRLARGAVGEAEQQFKAAFNPETVALTPAVAIALRRPEHDLLFTLRRAYRRRRRARS